MRIPRHYFIIPSLTQWIVRLVTLAWFRTHVVLEVYGLERIRTLKKPVLFVANHTSEWDGPLIRSVMPMFSQFTPMFYVSLPKKEYDTPDRDLLRRILWGGTTFKMVGAWQVYPGTGDLNRALAHHLAILRQKGALTIFPEGKRSRNGAIDEFKIGVSYLAATTQVPLIPVAITGINTEIVPEGYTKRRVTVEFGEPLSYPKNLSTSEDDMRQFAEKLRSRVQHLARKYSDAV